MNEKRARRILDKPACRVSNGSLIFTPKVQSLGAPKLVKDKATGLAVTLGPANGPTVTSEDVDAILADFP